MMGLPAKCGRVRTAKAALTLCFGFLPGNDLLVLVEAAAARVGG